MDTKLKKGSKGFYVFMGIICGLGFIAFLTGIMGWEIVINAKGHLFSYDPFGLMFWNSYSGNLIWTRGELITFGLFVLVGGILAIASLIYLIKKARTYEEDGVLQIKGVDRWYTEVQLALVALIVVFAGNVFLQSTYYLLRFVNQGFRLGPGGGVRNFTYSILNGQIWQGALGIIVGLAGAYLGLVLILSLVKKIKHRTFFKQSCIVIFVSYLYRIFFESGSTMRKVVLGALVIVLLSATVVLAPVVLIVILVFAPRFVEKVDAIKKGLDEVGSGNLSYKIPLDESKNGELEEIARGINQISEGSHMAVQNEIKNQRMKTELISNVSHDLKTPLTSLVTYIDLLKTEGLTSKNAPEYLDVLANKTNRLCVLTDNLFEAAKAASGSMPVKLEKVELVSLVNQSLGEMNQGIQDSELEFILSNKEESYFVWADGSLMSRVMENILGNALKYAMPNTRVYLDIKEGNGKEGHNSDIIQLEMKNVSKESLNMDPSELMERFTQGDESRNAEGSGLGLSITKDLMKIQNGWFEIKIDGDLFKCIVVLKKYKEEA